MTAVPSYVLAARRLARFIEHPTPADCVSCAGELSKLTDPAIKNALAQRLRGDALKHVLVAADDMSMSRSESLALLNRVFAGVRSQLVGVVPDDILEQAFKPLLVGRRDV